MILLCKLKEIECFLENIKHPNPNTELLNTIKSLKCLLLNIDYEFEKVPEYSYEKLKVILESVMGKKLSKEQEELIKHIVE